MKVRILWDITLYRWVAVSAWCYIPRDLNWNLSMLYTVAIVTYTVEIFTFIPCVLMLSKFYLFTN